MNQPYVTLILIPEFWRHSLVISQHNAKTPEKKVSFCDQQQGVAIRFFL